MIELLNIDCMEYMAGLPDKAFDLAIVDPPYGISIGNNKSGMGRRKGDRKAKYDMGEWDHNIPDESYFNELFRVSKNQIIWGGNYFNLPPTKCFIIWDKRYSENLSFAMYEYAWTSFDSVAKGYSLHSNNQLNRIHPTQKPIQLYNWVLKNYAKEGDKILDTHSGSGSLAISCMKRGFYYKGCEIDKGYYDLSCKRFKEQTAQMPLF